MQSVKSDRTDHELLTSVYFCQLVFKHVLSKPARYDMIWTWFTISTETFNPSHHSYFGASRNQTHSNAHVRR